MLSSFNMENINKERLKAVDNRNPDGTFGVGNNANPAGRPKGQTLKEYWREKFKGMTDEQKIEFTEKVGNLEIWRMAEGNPATATDITTLGKPIIHLAEEIIEKNEINTESVNHSEGSTPV